MRRRKRRSACAGGCGTNSRRHRQGERAPQRRGRGCRRRDGGVRRAGRGRPGRGPMAGERCARRHADQTPARRWCAPRTNWQGARISFAAIDAPLPTPNEAQIDLRARRSRVCPRQSGEAEDPRADRRHRAAAQHQSGRARRAVGAAAAAVDRQSFDAERARRTGRARYLGNQGWPGGLGSRRSVSRARNSPER